jgi:hypothetical protein
MLENSVRNYLVMQRGTNSSFVNSHFPCIFWQEQEQSAEPWFGDLPATEVKKRIRADLSRFSYKKRFSMGRSNKM